MKEDQEDQKNIIALKAASAKLIKSKVLHQKLSKMLKKKINSYYMAELMLQKIIKLSIYNLLSLLQFLQHVFFDS